MSMDNIFKLIDWLLYLYPIDGLWIIDELTFVNPEQAIEFCRRLKPYGLKWKCNLRADMVTREMLQALKDSGCMHAGFGVESADNSILKSMRRNMTIEQVEKALEISSEIGLVAAGGLIFGDPAETTESFWNSLNWFNKQKTERLFLRMITAYPGTHIYKTAVEKGLIEPVKFMKDGFPSVNITTMTDDEYFAMALYITTYSTYLVGKKLMDVSVELRSDYTVNITGKCPYCDERIINIHFHVLFNVIPQPCHSCGGNILINPIEFCDADNINNNINKNLLGKSAAIWAVTPYNFHWLLKAAPVLQADNVRFINKNDVIIPENGHIVKKLEGKEIFTPTIITHENIDTVIVPNNPKVFKEIKNQCDAEFPQVKRIFHITEFLK